MYESIKNILNGVLNGLLLLILAAVIIYMYGTNPTKDDFIREYTSQYRTEYQAVNTMVNKTGKFILEDNIQVNNYLVFSTYQIQAGNNDYEYIGFCDMICKKEEFSFQMLKYNFKKVMQSL